jgi:hypothetical protein
VNALRPKKAEVCGYCDRVRTVGPDGSAHEVPDLASVQVMPVTVDRWPDLEKVFGTRGDPSRCWCQWFFEGAQRGPGELATANKDALRAPRINKPCLKRPEVLQ